ncbi:MAG TPA: lipid-binding SYLF domain-containing protein [Pricia sp.]|nr:lipid-binding SYLF domain-containing protein [Pricia sp.]
MKIIRKVKTITFIGILLFCFTAVAQTKEDKRIMNDVKKAEKALLKADSGLQEYFDNAAGYAIFPNVGKGGFIVGAASGNGALYETGIAVGMADLKKLSVGFQIGGQAIIEVIFFESEADLAEFKGDEFEFSAQISAIALKSGVAANAKYKEGVAVFVLPKAGLMADVSVGGQKFSYTAF